MPAWLTVHIIPLFILGSSMKAKRIFTKTLIATCFVAFFLPLLLIDTKTVYSERENRKLAGFPHIESNGRVNWSFFNELDTYIKDRFGFRHLLIAIDNEIGLRIFNASGTDHVLIGKRGWLYYTKTLDGDNYSDFMKQNLVSENTIERFVSQLKARFDWCKENDIKFIFMIAPNKHTIYPENYRFERPPGKTRAEQFLEALDRESIEYIYPKNELISQKTNHSYPLYYLTDTHWNHRGAWLAFNQLSPAIKKNFPDTEFPDVSFDYSLEQRVGRGDLTGMLGRKKYGMDWYHTFSPHEPNWMDSFSYVKNEERDGVIISGTNKSLPKAIVYRDSFFSALVPYVSTQFSEAAYEWKMFGKKEKTRILEEKPDIIIWEVVERYMDRISDLTF